MELWVEDYDNMQELNLNCGPFLYRSRKYLPSPGLKRPHKFESLGNPQPCKILQVK